LRYSGPGKKGCFPKASRPSLARFAYIKNFVAENVRKSEETGAAILPYGDGLTDFYLPVGNSKNEDRTHKVQIQSFKATDRASLLNTV
jgi:hypothetical protein